MCIFQSTLPREERQLLQLFTKQLFSISIHAPTRGATLMVATLREVVVFISIHAPTRGATELPQLGGSNSQFQSTLPREERRYTMSTKQKIIIISIHAPTRGATFLIHTSNLSKNFNPRSHERSDEEKTLNITNYTKFQSTLPREERRKLQPKTAHYIYFNPRSHERSDAEAIRKMVINNISIHAPTRGATPFCQSSLILNLYFNPRSHERSDDNPYGLSDDPDNFNPRSHERSDVLNCPFQCNRVISIHAPTRGATIFSVIRNSIDCISIHAPTRGATALVFLHSLDT